MLNSRFRQMYVHRPAFSMLLMFQFARARIPRVCVNKRASAISGKRGPARRMCHVMLTCARHSLTHTHTQCMSGWCEKLHAVRAFSWPHAFLSPCPTSTAAVCKYLPISINMSAITRARRQPARVQRKLDRSERTDLIASRP